MMLLDVLEQQVQEEGKRPKQARSGSQYLKEAKISPTVPKKVVPLKSSPFNGTFPFKLHEKFKSTGSEYSHIISWQEHGHQWKVHDQEELAKIIPKFFY